MAAKKKTAKKAAKKTAKKAVKKPAPSAAKKTKKVAKVAKKTAARGGPVARPAKKAAARSAPRARAIAPETEILQRVRELRASGKDPAAVFQAAAELLKEHIGCGLLNFFIKRDLNQSGSPLELAGVFFAEESSFRAQSDPESRFTLSAGNAPAPAEEGALIRTGSPGFALYRFPEVDEESGTVNASEIQVLGKNEEIASALILPIALPGQKRPAGVVVCVLFGGVPPYGEADRVTADIVGGLFEDLLLVRLLHDQSVSFEATRTDDREALVRQREDQQRSETELLNRQQELERELGKLKDDSRDRERELTQSHDLELTRTREALVEKHKTELAEIQNRIAGLEGEADRVREQLQSEHASRINTVKSEYATQIESLRSEHGAEVKSLQAELQAAEELRRRVEELDATRSELENDLDAARKKNAEETESLQSAHAAELERKENERKDLEERLGQITGERDELQKERTTIAGSFEGRIADLERDIQETEKQADLRIKNYERKLSVLNEEFAALRDERDAARSEQETQKQELETKIGGLNEELESTRAALQEEKDRQSKLRSETSTLRDELSGKESSYSKKESEYENRVRQLSELLEKTRSELETANKEHAAAMEREKQENDSLLKEQEREYEERIADLSRTLSGARDDRETALKDLEEKKREFNQKVASLEARHQDADKGIRSLTEEKQAALEKIAGLEKELTSAREEARSARQTLEEERKSSGGRIGELEATLQRQEQSIQSLTEEKSGLENRLSSLNAELEETRAKFAETEQTLEQSRMSHSERVAGLEQELKTARASIEELTQSKTRFEQDLAATRSELETFQNREAEAAARYEKTIDTLKSERDGLQRQLQQEENNYHQKIYELNQEVDRATQKLARQKKEVEEELAGAKTNLEERRKEYEASLSGESRKSAALRDEIARHEKTIAAREETVRDLEQRLATAEEAGQGLTEERDAANASIARLNRELESLRREFADEQAALEKKQAEALSERETELKRARTEIATLQERADGLAQRLAGAESDLRGLRANKKENEETIRSLTSESETRKKEIGEHESRIKKLMGERDSLKDDLKTRTGELSEAGNSIKQFKQELGIHRERETRLEQDIAGLEEQIHNLKTRITAGKGRENELSANIDGLKKEISALKTDLSEMQQKEKRLGEDLAAARERERGSKEEGHLLASITHSLSNVVDLSDKLKYIVDSAFEDCDIQRIALFSLVGENQLRLEDGFLGQERLHFLKHRHFSMSDTAFGQAIASGQPQRVAPQKGLENPDLPDPIREAILQHFATSGVSVNKDDLAAFLLVPLIESGRVLGLLTAAAPKKNAFDDRISRLMDNVSPVLAIALKYEHNLSELRRFHATTSYRDNALDYLQSRFMKAGADIRKIASDIQVKIPEHKEEPWFDDSVLYKIASLSEMPVLHLKDDARAAAEFETWLSILSRRAAEKINLEPVVTVPLESLQLLQHHLGASFKFLFWLAAEAVENVIRHSQATKLSISVDQPQNDRIRLAITDNGEGVVRTSGKENPDGNGLRAIQNLGRSTGGEVRLARDENNHGLSIEIVWELEEE